MVETLKPKIAAEFANSVYSEGYLSAELKREILGDEQFAIPGTAGELKSVTGARLRRWGTEHGRGLAIQGRGDKWGTHLFLVFRGTFTKTDCLTDIRLGYQRLASCEPVHIGFDQAFQGMKPQLEAFLQGKSRECTVHCVGHSLGGALASLTAHWLRDKMEWPRVKLYTFGCPRVSGSIFADKTTKKIGEENIFRVYNQYDPVPCTPAFPYVHAPYALGGSSKKYCVSFVLGKKHPHHMGSYLHAVGEKSWEELAERKPMTWKRLIGWRKGVSLKQGLADRVLYPFGQLGRLFSVAIFGVGLVLHTSADKLVWSGIQLHKLKSKPKTGLTLDADGLEQGVFEQLGIPYEKNADLEALAAEVNDETIKVIGEQNERVKAALQEVEEL